MGARVVGGLRGRRRVVLSAGLLTVLGAIGVWVVVGWDSSRDDVRTVTMQAPTATTTEVALSDSPRVDSPTSAPTAVAPTPTPPEVVSTPTPSVVTPTQTPRLAVPTATPEFIRVPAEVHRDGPGMGFSECVASYFDWGPRSDYDVVAWSPDGSEVYFTDRGEIFGLSVDGWRLRLIASARPSSADSNPSSSVGRWTSFAVAPDGSQVVYVGCLGPPTEFRYFDLFRVSRDGTGAERLTATGSTEFYPSWSPDGHRIAFLSDVDTGYANASRMRLYNMAADGTDVRPVLDDDFIVLHQPPQWSPDSQHLAVVRYTLEKRGFAETISQSGRELYVVGSDGAEPRRLAENVVSGPAWSPDGQRLAYARANGDGVALYTIGSDGTGELWITDIPHWRGPRSDSVPAEAWIDTVVWSPDGARILVRSDDAAAFVVTLETGRKAELGLDGVRASAWSPDGSRLALIAGRWRLSGPLMVVTTAADGTDLRMLAEREDPHYSDSKLRTQGGHSVPGTGDAAACRNGGAVPNPDANDQLVRPCVELIRLQQSLVSGDALNWSPERPMARWDGVVVGGSPLAVREMDLSGRGLRGALAVETSWLPHLHTLVLRDNSLDGQIPRAFGQLSDLETLDLSNNQFTGSIPSELGELTKLRTLDLSSNQLSGEIPAWLSELPSLEDVALSGNQFTGCVPRGLPLRDPDALDLPICEPAT